MRIFDADGGIGTGYSYTIGTGGPSVMKLIEHTLGPALIGREASEIERIWRDLLFLTHATSVGAITSLALAAIDTALWDLKCRRHGEPLHRMAGGAQSRVPLYTTEGGWLHIETSALVDDALAAQGEGLWRLQGQDRQAACLRRRRAAARRCATPSGRPSRS